MASLREIFPRVIGLDRAHGVRLAQTPQVQAAKLGPLPLLQDFFQATTGTQLSAQQQAWAEQALTASQKES
jgi:hypothetical protein